MTFSGSYSGGSGSNEIAWDFNYGGTFNTMVSGTLSPSYVFMSPGDYKVALKVTDNNNDCSKIDVLTVISAYQGPTVEAGPDQSVDAGVTVDFNGSYSDPDGTVSSSGIAWDFDWTGDFTADATDTLTPSWQYDTAGSYTVALQVTDDNGMADIDFLQVVVNYVTPYVNSGPDRSIAAGETASFLGFHRMSGSVASSGIEWDFDYDGISFDPDSSVTGNLTPSREFNTPGSYTVALRVTDDTGVSRIDTTSVTVANVRPVASINPSLAVSQGQSANFSLSISCPDPVDIEWDFHYEDGVFSSDPSAAGQLNPTHQYLAAGIFLAAVRVTNTVGGASSFRTIVVSVDNVSPTATVTNSGITPEGSPLTITISGANDPNSAVSFDYEADWTGSGDFAFIPETWRSIDPITGAASFSHVFDDNGTYTATIRVSDNEGGFTDYIQTVTIVNVAPTVVLQPVSADFVEIGTGVPIRLYVTDPSHGDHLAGFTYFYSIDDGPFVETISADFLLPAPNPNEYDPYIVRGYAVDKDGAGPTTEKTIYVARPDSDSSHVGSQLQPRYQREYRDR
ncbi:MAG: PKD domain-containing protein [Gemmataceae bacterium]|nr:PKD domain-containing protein [Gemmataceae bacterium]